MMWLIQVQGVGKGGWEGRSDGVGDGRLQGFPLIKESHEDPCIMWLTQVQGVGERVGDGRGEGLGEANGLPQQNGVSAGHLPEADLLFKDGQVCSKQEPVQVVAAEGDG
ncbi:MAG TPA: hypothetical protein VMW29_02885 [Candidatus Bathyarchaeia archaeon]|nr:hypothetical protein [Candidatus Bathyarchaeia archaeon]